MAEGVRHRLTVIQIDGETEMAKASSVFRSRLNVSVRQFQIESLESRVMMVVCEQFVERGLQSTGLSSAGLGDLQIRPRYLIKR